LLQDILLVALDLLFLAAELLIGGVLLGLQCTAARQVSTTAMIAAGTRCAAAGVAMAAIAAIAAVVVRRIFIRIGFLH
jgi:hypothetical protein